MLKSLKNHMLNKCIYKGKIRNDQWACDNLRITLFIHRNILFNTTVNFSFLYTSYILFIKIIKLIKNRAGALVE